MKIAFICAGDIQVPPPSWGAVEILVWEYYNNLKSLGVDVSIYNTKDLNWVNKEIQSQNFDFIHLQHEDYLPYIKIPNNKKFAVTAHCGWAENYTNYDPYYWKTFKQIIESKHYIFALSEQIKQNYVNFGVNPSNIYITKNGVNTEKYRVTDNPKYHDRSLYLGKFEKRKRQHILSEHELDIDFAGFGNELKISKSNNILGIWNKNDVYTKTTDYANLILLSESEAHPLVCMEALSSGLGLVLSENSAANLSIKPFISIIPETKIQDINYIDDLIQSNRQYSIEHREEIVEYSKQFDWKLVSRQYLSLIKNIVGK